MAQIVASPGTMADGGGLYAWTNHNNAKVSDDTYAVYDDGPETEVSNYLLATNFGFSIPVGATIVGIVAEVEAKCASGKRTFPAIRIIKSGSVGTTNRTTGDITTTEQYLSAGGSDDLWGETWTYSDINASDFGVAYKGSTGIISVDHIRITVYYTEQNIVGPFPTFIQ